MSLEELHQEPGLHGAWGRGHRSDLGGAGPEGARCVRVTTQPWATGRSCRKADSVQQKTGQPGFTSPSQRFLFVLKNKDSRNAFITGPL